MARINIEEDAHKRIAKLADYRGCSRREALGTVGYLWGESQELLRVEGTREEIIDWSGLFGLSDEDIDLWISAMIRSRFLSAVDGGFKIHGNETQIENRVARIHRSSKGGASTKKKWKAIKKQKRVVNAVDDKKATSLLEASCKPSGTNQFNSIQSNANQPNPEQCNSDQGVLIPADEKSSELPKKARKPKKPKVEDPSAEVRRATFAAYSEAYRKRWGHEPADNATVRSQIKYLVERVGQEAPALARFYLSHNDSFFVKDCHPVGILLMKCEGLLTQMRREKPITTADVKRLEKSQQQQGMIDEAKQGGF